MSIATGVSYVSLADVPGKAFFRCPVLRSILGVDACWTNLGREQSVRPTQDSCVDQCSHGGGDRTARFRRGNRLPGYGGEKWEKKDGGGEPTKGGSAPTAAEWHRARQPDRPGACP